MYKNFLILTFGLLFVLSVPYLSADNQIEPKEFGTIVRIRFDKRQQPFLDYIKNNLNLDEKEILTYLRDKKSGDWVLFVKTINDVESNSVIVRSNLARVDKGNIFYVINHIGDKVIYFELPVQYLKAYLKGNQKWTLHPKMK